MVASMAAPALLHQRHSRRHPYKLDHPALEQRGAWIAPLLDPHWCCTQNTAFSLGLVMFYAPVISAASSLPWSETERLAALRSYGVLDTTREAAFDEITQVDRKSVV